MALNEQQNAIVEFIEIDDRSLNVIARAGCGKTFTLVEGIVRAIVDKKLGSAVLMAFNKSASVEFEQRIARMGPVYEEVDTGTVHSLGFRAWRANRRVKVEQYKVGNIVREHGNNGDETAKEHWAAVVKLVSLAKQSAIGIVCEIDDRERWYGLIEHFDVDVNGSEEDVIDLAIEVLQESNEQGESLVDFDDMIYLPLLFNARMQQYDFVLIDEAQDTNVTRRLLAFRMMKPNGRLVAVGDDRQAIYGFSGANSDSLEIIRRELNSAVLPLTLTYRCPQNVVAEANALVPDLQAHESAPMGVVRHLEAVNYENGASWFESEAVGANDVALCRNTRPLVDTAYRMIAAGKACRVEGRDIGEGLVTLATKWKSIKRLDELEAKLVEFLEHETEKWTKRNAPQKIQIVEDKVSTLQLIIDNLTADGAVMVQELVSHIRNLFGDTPDGEKPHIFTLSTIHKSKGREWERVYLLRPDLLPSKYAKQEWQMEQEENLKYVAITRAKAEFVYINGE